MVPVVSPKPGKKTAGKKRADAVAKMK